MRPCGFGRNKKIFVSFVSRAAGCGFDCGQSCVTDMKKNWTRCSLALFVIWAGWQCRENLSPLSPEPGAPLALRLSFHGRLLSRSAELGKARTAAEVQRISRIEARVFASEGGAVLDSAIIPLGSEQFTFRADLTVPSGSGRVVEVDAFEEIDDDDKGNSFFSVLAWRGRKTGITVVRRDTVRVAVQLFPVPIPGQRVVLEVGDGAGTRGSTGNPVTLALANLDRIRGLQFDLLYNNDLVTPARFDSLGRIIGFKGIRAEIVTDQTESRLVYRVLIVDQSNPPGEIAPVGRTLEPETIARILFNVASGTGAATDTLRLVSAVATTASLQDLEVFVKDDGIFTVR